MKVLQSIRSRKLTVLLLIPDTRLLPQPARCKCFNATRHQETVSALVESNYTGMAIKKVRQTGPTLM
jgi:hypothetical protein